MKDIVAAAKQLAKWDRRFLNLAGEVSTWSKDPSTQVGAVIIDDLRQVVSLGYNGFPRGVSDSPRRLSIRTEKYPRIVHAELNAILSARSSVKGCTLYCTMLCCNECAKAIIQSGILRVVVPTPRERNDRWEDAHLIACEMLDEAQVQVDFS